MVAELPPLTIDNGWPAASPARRARSASRPSFSLSDWTKTGGEHRGLAVRLDKRETGQVDTYAVQLCTRELFDSGGYIQQLVIVHIALPDVAQVRHQNYFVSASLVVCGIRHRPDDLPLRVEGSVSIPGGVLRFAAHRRADEPFFRGKIVQTFQIGYPGISQHGQPAVQIGFRDLGIAAIHLGYAGNLDAMLIAKPFDRFYILSQMLQINRYTRIHNCPFSFAKRFPVA